MNDLPKLRKGFSFNAPLYQLVIQMPPIEQKTHGGIILAQETIKGDQIESRYGLVISVGDMAYKDEGRFGKGNPPACKVGDWVVIKKYSGNKLFVEGEDGNDIELRIIDDDQILLTTNTPEMIRKR